MDSSRLNKASPTQKDCIKASCFAIPSRIVTSRFSVHRLFFKDSCSFCKVLILSNCACFSDSCCVLVVEQTPIEFFVVTMLFAHSIFSSFFLINSSLFSISMSIEDVISRFVVVNVSMSFSTSDILVNNAVVNNWRAVFILSSLGEKIRFNGPS